MKPIIQKMWMLITILCASISAAAYDFEVDGIYYNVISLEDKTCKVVSGDSKYSGEVRIPENVVFSNREFTVTSIQENLFSGNTSLTSISIPKTIRGVAKEMFEYCTNLQEVDLSEGIDSIGASAFYRCYKLKNISIPSSVKIIGKSAFYDSNLKNIELHEGLEKIGDQAFDYCQLKSISFPKSLVSIGGIWCSSISELTIPPYVTYFGGIDSKS